MTDHDALLAACREHPDEHTPQLAFADFLEESDQPERAELIRATVERERLRNEDVNQTRIKNLNARRRDLESRLSRWPCPGCESGRPGKTRITRQDYPEGKPPGYQRPRIRIDCPACGGSGDVLRQRVVIDHVGTSHGVLQLPLRWHAGYPLAVTLPTLVGDAVRDMWGQLSTSLPDCAPTPRLRALCQTPPWGVPLEAVIVADREPYQDVGCLSGALSGESCFDWHPQSSYPRDDTPDLIPDALLDVMCRLFPERVAHNNGIRVLESATPDAARLALGRAVFAFGCQKNE